MPSENLTFIEQARRSQIVGCAAEVIAEVGLARASMARIAERAEISVGVISYHFGNKAGMIAAVVEHVAATAVAIMEPQIVGQPTAMAGLRMLITSNLDFMRRHPRELRALLEIIRHDAAGSDQQGVYATQGVQAVTDVQRVLAWGHATGEFRDFDSRTMAITIRAAIDAVPALIGVLPDLDLVAYGVELADIFERATTAHPIEGSS
ncbi:TetR/AcrR family transcriptional regulator [Pseudonocardia sp. GCM10023141]|uniref:TetR/AcrR family transcriptional regulator n=1 Tax=Pseudonocardia sp. GCM10023141 TaxID=3252653 RepID=UPI00360FA828